MPYSVKYHPEARDQLAKLIKDNRAIGQDILDKIKWLAANVDQIKHQQLSRQWAGFFRLRAGDYRITAEIFTRSYRTSVRLLSTTYCGEPWSQYTSPTAADTPPDSR
jgi:mRNA interferase RelE/StbE